MVPDVSIRRIVSAYNVEKSKKKVCETTRLSLKVRNAIFNYSQSYARRMGYLIHTDAAENLKNQTDSPVLLSAYKIYGY